MHLQITKGSFMKLGTTTPNLKIVTAAHIQRNRAKGVMIMQHKIN
jgi:hypothetical protein